MDNLDPEDLDPEQLYGDASTFDDNAGVNDPGPDVLGQSELPFVTVASPTNNPNVTNTGITGGRSATTAPSGTATGAVVANPTSSFWSNLLGAGETAATNVVQSALQNLPTNATPNPKAAAATQQTTAAKTAAATAALTAGNNYMTYGLIGLAAFGIFWALGRKRD